MDINIDDIDIYTYIYVIYVHTCVYVRIYCTVLFSGKTLIGIDFGTDFSTYTPVF